MNPKLSAQAEAVRTRRAYFDFRFGQLHVRTAFPATGGFDEQVTLFYLHPEQSSSRLFTRFLPEIADVRSVYAPDLPGCGESDPSRTLSAADAADAIADLPMTSGCARSTCWQSIPRRPLPRVWQRPDRNSCGAWC